MSKLYACLNRFDIKQNIAQINKTCTSLDFPDHKYKIFDRYL